MKIALKNSALSEEEFDENREEIEDIVLKERISIIGEAITKNKTTGVKLARDAGISVDEIYEWYFNGKEGDEKYKVFAMIFELGVIIPRVLTFRRARDIGISVKFLNKKLKKDLGSADYGIWKKYDIINQKMEFFDSESEGIDGKKVRDILENSEFFNFKHIMKNSKKMDTLNKILEDESKSTVSISVEDNIDIEKKEAMGK